MSFSEFVINGVVYSFILAHGFSPHAQRSLFIILECFTASEDHSSYGYAHDFHIEDRILFSVFFLKVCRYEGVTLGKSAMFAVLLLLKAGDYKGHKWFRKLVEVEDNFLLALDCKVPVFMP